MARKKRYNDRIDTWGHVAKAQVPMIMTFDKKNAEFIVEHLAEALESAYKIIHMFGESEYDDDPFDE